MKKSFIIGLVAFFCFVGSAQAQNWDADLWGPSLIDNTGLISDPTLGKRLNYGDGSWFQGVVDSYGNPQAGTYQFANGDVYVGNLSNRNRNGMGVYTYRNGNWIMCEWVNGNPNGVASFYNASTRQYFDQVYRNGQLISEKQVSRPTYDKETWRYQFVGSTPTNNSNSYNNSNSGSSNRSYGKNRSCHACHGSGRLKKSVPDVSGYGISSKRYYCNECGETSMSRHIHINCTYCR
jgi:hypothetical protein